MDPRGVLIAAREAAMEARRAHRQLAQLDKERQGRTPELHRASLLHRLDLCESAADRARAVLDAMADTGVAQGWVIDAARLYYVDGCDWTEAGDAVCYSARHAQRMVGVMLDAAGEPDSMVRESKSWRVASGSEGSPPAAISL